jgi:flagellin-like protein
MKIWKNVKALSPVVASIILIAVTVAVSIAVAAWMGALTFTFMGTEKLSITNVQFGGTTTKWVAITANNTGDGPITINEVWVGTSKQTYTPETVQANAGTLINFTYTWVNGYNYALKLVSAKGNQFPYTASAPSS